MGELIGPPVIGYNRGDRDGCAGQGERLQNRVVSPHRTRLSQNGELMRVSAILLIQCLIAWCGVASADLIANGGFESGPGGFSTDYEYTSDLTSSGTVVVGYDPCDHHPLAASYGDHTSGRGRMLIANGSTDGSAAVWEQTVSVAPNTEYAFYYWLSTWTPSTSQQTQIRCLFDGVRTGPAGFTPSDAGDWGVVLFRWKSGAASQVNIRLVDRTGTIENNDFALDDIGMLATAGNNVLLTSSSLGGSVESPGEGAFLYGPGEMVALEAKCQPGYEFAGWAGEFSDPGVRIWADMSVDRVATAVFHKLDYPVTIKASATLPNEFSTCDESADRLDVLLAALESGTPNGLVLGERRGLCGATYRFPVFRPATGIRGISRIVVNVYGTTVSSGSTVWIGGTGPHRPIAGNVHSSFRPDGIPGLLEDSQEPVYWLPVRINAATGNWDLAAAYVSYECPGIPQTLLRRFHDHFSVVRAIERYTSDQGIRDLYSRVPGAQPVWQGVMQVLALAEDSAEVDGVDRAAVASGLRELIERRPSVFDSGDLSALAECDSAEVVACLDRAASSGRSHVAVYANALADGILSSDEVYALNAGLAQWRTDLVALEAAMANTFDSLCKIASMPGGAGRLAAETMILAMSPWLAGRQGQSGQWTLADPTYLGQVIDGLGQFETP